MPSANRERSQGWEIHPAADRPAEGRLPSRDIFRVKAFHVAVVFFFKKKETNKLVWLAAVIV